ncbi:ABC transporter ATP-binding protein [Paraburkholderia humisilvae]|uniref:sn-glycerol-3-phosphate import ATP-binding protein UgpC n=1 Tax=Paraburkholderia humisilvae TaxID=627669 RepID=A0A6J5D594_9BURK|nr:ABC transporter ATP-binding protein [Paraburkholderia humisilvae]CAB3749460.1 sn-glycerol-3-phosphate import ATP-binding protein UgpC [Paraburkholderia humisilvae]
MASVHLSDVTRRFGAHVAADRVNLSVNEGEFVALVGPSGCGKSTLLRMIAGLDWPDAGAIRIGERDVAALEAAERDVAMVFQNYALYPHLTIRQNLATPLALRRLRAWERMPLLWRLSSASRERHARIDADVSAAADLLGIGALLERKPAALSGGQRQRVALGRAIVRQPAVFLYDEPLSNLDAELRASMRSEIVELHRRLGVATIYVTHDQVEAMTMADRIAVMRGGRILQFGTPAELYTEPASLEVARTLGTPGIGVLRATVRASSAGLATACGCVLPLAVHAAQGASVSIGLRAEHLALTSIGDHGALPARVLQVECLGADTLVHVGLYETHAGAHRAAHGEAQPRLIVRAPRGLAEIASLPRSGDVVGVRADLSHALVFDDAGRRVTHDVIVSGASMRRVAHV